MQSQLPPLKKKTSELPVPTKVTEKVLFNTDFDSIYQSVRQELEKEKIFFIPKNDVVFELKKNTSFLNFTMPKESSPEYHSLTPYIKTMMEYYTKDFHVAYRSNELFSYYPKPKEVNLSLAQKLVFDIDEITPTKSNSENIETIAPLQEKPALKEIFQTPDNIPNSYQSTSSRKRHYSNNSLMVDGETFEKVKLGSNEKLDFKLNGKENKIDFALMERTPLGDIFGGAVDELDENSTDTININVKSKRFQIQLESTQWNGPLMIDTFGQISIFDKASHERLTETFNFKTSGVSIVGESKAIFEISNPNPDMMLVIRLDKSFEGSLSDWFDSYAKGKLPDVKKSSKVYKQPFAWTAIPLFDGIFPGSEPGKKSYATEWFFRQDDTKLSDEDFFAFLAGVKQQISLKKWKIAPIKLLMKVEALSMESTNDIPLEELVDPMLETSLTTIRATNSIYCLPYFVNLSKGSSNWKNIAIKVQLLNSDNQNDSKRSQQFLEKSHETEVITAISYHNKSPYFYEEIKIKLPTVLTPTHHLFFTFYQISYKHEKEDCLIGYSFLKLLNENVIIPDGEVKLPIIVSLADSYLSNPDSLKFFDQGKSLFVLRLRVSSSFYTNSSSLHRFLQVGTEDADETALNSAIKDLGTVDHISIGKFWPHIMNTLLHSLCSKCSSDTISKKYFKGMISILSVLHRETISRHPIALHYIRYHSYKRGKKDKLIFEEIVQCWLSLFREGDPIARDTGKYSWFFLSLIWKSMVEYLNESGNLNSSFLERKKILKQSYLETLGLLLKEISSEIYRLGKSGFNIAKSFNEHLAVFYQRLLSCININFVFENILRHIQGFDMTGININLKFVFLEKICNYEHAILLSIPSKHTFVFDKASSIITNNAKHFFPSLLFHESIAALKYESESMRLKGFHIMRCIFNKYENDSRYRNNVESLSKIFNMYLFVIPATCDLVERFNEKSRNSFSANERNSILICFLYVIRYIDKNVLLQWVEKESSNRLVSLLQCLSLVGSTFQYIGKDQVLEDFANGLSTMKLNLSQDTAKRFIENAYKNTTNGIAGGNLREMRNNLRNMGNSKTKIVGNSVPARNTTFGAILESQAPPEALEEVALAKMRSHESSITIMVTVSTFLDIMRNSTTVHDLESLFGVIYTLMECPQSTSDTILVIRVVARFIQEFPKIILKGNTLATNICYGLLLYLMHQNVDVRNYASESIYLLMKTNFAETKCKNIAKVRVQLTVGLSKMELFNPTSLKKGLQALSIFATKDAANLKGFHTFVSECTTALIVLMKDNIRMHEYQDDPDTEEEMYFKIAQGYVNMPDLRISFIEKLGDLFTERNCFCEAAFCRLYCAVIVSECLKYWKLNIGNPSSAKEFRACSVNLTHEPPFKPDFNPDEEGICQSSVFSKEGFVNLLEKSVHLFKKAQLFEIAIECIKILLPIYEKEKKFPELIEFHNQISSFYQDIISTAGKRVLGTYFCVSFYGRKFGELDGKQFIYKEKLVTQLSEVCSRITTSYKAKFENSFELINDSTKVDRKKLDSEKVYCSVIHCDPYFDEHELLERTSYFEKMNEISRFYYEMPYTLNPSKAHGETADQYKRKTILKTIQPFPFVKKRLEVIEVVEIELSPIEVAIESLAERCLKLKLAVEAKPSNLKNIQLLLQGIVRPQVNRGPLEFAHVFLDQKNITNYPKEKTSILQQKFSELYSLCGNALRISQELSSEDQYAYNDDLEEGYSILKKKLREILKNDSLSERPLGLSFFSSMNNLEQ